MIINLKITAKRTTTTLSGTQKAVLFIPLLLVVCATYKGLKPLVRKIFQCFFGVTNTETQTVFG